MKAVLYFDGGCRPTNPGPAGFACLVHFPGGEYEDYKVARFCGWRTNNEAEYSGLLVGIKMARDRNVKYLHIITDSKLVEQHLLGTWRCKEPRLKSFLVQARDLLKKNFGDNWHIEWVKGHGDDDLNNEVDALCTKVILAHIEKRRAVNPFTKKAGLIS